MQKLENVDEMYKMYESIATEFNIPILDYSYDLMCDDTTYFYNGTHLNKLGAEVFTTKLAHDIDSLGLLK
jgi:lysophospholipase L1-like esterase